MKKLALSLPLIVSGGLSAVSCNSSCSDVDPKEDDRVTEVVEATENKLTVVFQGFFECGEGDHFDRRRFDFVQGDDYFAPDRDGDGIRDSLNPDDVRCVSVKAQDAVWAARFARDFRSSIGPKESFNVAPFTLGAQDPASIVDILMAKGVFTDRAQAEFAGAWLIYSLAYSSDFAGGIKAGDRYGASAILHRLDEGAMIEIKNGVLSLKNTWHPIGLEASLMPWADAAMPVVDEAGLVDYESTLSTLVPILAPVCPGFKEDRGWVRPESSLVASGLQYQSGAAAEHATLSQLADVLPFEWTLAAGPDSESGLALSIVFDCCDFEPDHVFAEAQAFFGIGPHETFVHPMHGGFVVVNQSGFVVLEPGSITNTGWGPESTGVMDADRLENSTLSHSDLPQYKTETTVLRPGQRVGSNWSDGWCRNTLPAGIAGIRQLVGTGPFILHSANGDVLEGLVGLEVIGTRPLPSSPDESPKALLELRFTEGPADLAKSGE